ncbi:MAG TPA: methyltransferase domain-containing protein [Kofleriaceae bacterium]|jgi:predicted TPR repeat methyltransferase|nr:methyltransferase domain-containing protein [Kofleriaceae bacterium]
MKRKKVKPARRPARSATELVVEGFALHQRGDAAAAEAAYRAALAQEPDHHGALGLLAMMALERDDAEAAAALFTRAIAIAPEVAWYHLNLGHAYAASGLDDRAVAAMTASVGLDPESPIPGYDLARHHLRHGRPAAALVALRQVLAVDPAHARAGFLVASLSGGHVATAPADYVTELFDSYAPSFEAHLVSVLDYQAPHQLAALVTAAGHAPARAWQVADLGCGSGLGGVAFRDFARHLIGSDLSPRMVELARARGVYDELHVEDLTQTLQRAAARDDAQAGGARRDDAQAGDARLDLIVAADVFIYVGALEAAFAAAAAALRPGGLLAFSTERWDGAGGDHSDDHGDDHGDGHGYRLLPSSRYAHADGYIRALAERHGFAIRAAEATAIRSDHGAPIAGVLYLLAAGPA